MHKGIAHRDHDIYLGNEQRLYNNSVYKLENNLFDALDAGNQKLNELPFDKIFIIFMGALMISFLAYLGLPLVYDAAAISFEQSIQNVLVSMLIAPILAFYAIIMPVLTYRRRRRSDLLWKLHLFIIRMFVLTSKATAASILLPRV